MRLPNGRSLLGSLNREKSLMVLRMGFWVCARPVTDALGSTGAQFAKTLNSASALVASVIAATGSAFRLARCLMLPPQCKRWHMLSGILADLAEDGLWDLVFEAPRMFTMGAGGYSSVDLSEGRFAAYGLAAAAMLLGLGRRRWWACCS